MEKRINPNIKMFGIDKDIVMLTSNALNTSMSALTEAIIRQGITDNASALKFDGELVNSVFKTALLEEFSEVRRYLMDEIVPIFHLHEYEKLFYGTMEEFKKTAMENLDELIENDPSLEVNQHSFADMHEQFLEGKVQNIIESKMTAYMKSNKPEFISGYKIFENFCPNEFKLMLSEFESVWRAAHSGLRKEVNASLILFISKLIYDKKILLLIRDFEEVSQIKSVLDEYIENHPSKNPYYSFYKLIFEWEIVKGNKVKNDDHQEVKQFFDDYFFNRQFSNEYFEVGEVINRIKGKLNILEEGE